MTIDDSRPGRIEVTAPAMAKVVITVEDTKVTNVTVNVHDRTADHVKYVIGVFKRTARCEAHGDGLDAAESICRSLRVEPGPREPRITISVDGTGVKGLASYKRAIKALEPKLAACWTTAAAADPELTEGAVILGRTSHPSKTSATPLTGPSRLLTFRKGDTAQVAACMFPLLESVPAKLAKTASLSASVGCTGRNGLVSNGRIPAPWSTAWTTLAALPTMSLVSPT